MSGLLIRPETPADRKYVDSTWVTNFRQSCDSGPLPRDVSWTAYCEAIARLRARPTGRIAVVARAAVPDYLIGFIAWEPGGHHRHAVDGVMSICAAPALWYIYVEQPQRGSGVAKELLAHAGINPARRFCFQYRTPAMRDRVQGALRAASPRRPWFGGRFDSRTYLSLEDEQPLKEHIP